MLGQGWGVGVGWGHGGSIRPEVGNWDLGGSWWGMTRTPPEVRKEVLSW